MMRIPDFLTFMAMWCMLLGCQSNTSWESEVDAVFNEKFTANTPGGAVLIMKGEKILYFC